MPSHAHAPAPAHSRAPRAHAVQLFGLALIIVGALSLTQVVDFFTSKNLGIGAALGRARARTHRDSHRARADASVPGLIILGVLIFFISFIGLLGALKTNRGLLKFVRSSRPRGHPPAPSYTPSHCLASPCSRAVAMSGAEGM